MWNGFELFAIACAQFGGVVSVYSMKVQRLPNPSRVLEVVTYDRESGLFHWRTRPATDFTNGHPWTYKIWNKRYAGQVAGTFRADGYVRIAIDEAVFYAHRLAWLLVHGEPVPSEIDHIDGDPGNNRIENLRAATHSANLANSRTHKNNLVGIKGVEMSKSGRRFEARIRWQGRRYYVGTYATLEEAMAARREAAERLHGKFARHE